MAQPQCPHVTNPVKVKAYRPGSLGAIDETLPENGRIVSCTHTLIRDGFGPVGIPSVVSSVGSATSPRGIQGGP